MLPSVSVWDDEEVLEGGGGHMSVLVSGKCTLKMAKVVLDMYLSPYTEAEMLDCLDRRNSERQNCLRRNG